METQEQDPSRLAQIYQRMLPTYQQWLIDSQVREAETLAKNQILTQENAALRQQLEQADA